MNESIGRKKENLFTCMRKKARLLAQKGEAKKDFRISKTKTILPYVESAGFTRWAFQQVKDLERLIKGIESIGLFYLQTFQFSKFLLEPISKTI